MPEMSSTSLRREMVTRGAVGRSSGKGGKVEPALEEGYDAVDAILMVTNLVYLVNIVRIYNAGRYYLKKFDRK